MDTPIATRQLLYVSPQGEHRNVTLSVGMPHEHPDGGWACPVALDGFFADLNEIRGEDAWQALTAAIAFLAQLLTGLVERRGGSLRYPGDESTEVDLSRLFVGGA
jgi:hypothetical protein